MYLLNRSCSLFDQSISPVTLQLKNCATSNWATQRRWRDANYPIFLMTTRTSVLIVGGGLSGLIAAVALGWHGVQTLQHPRADGFIARTVEIFRSLGFSKEDIPEKPAGFQLRRARVESLTGKWFDALAWNPKNDQAEDTGTRTSSYSP